MTLHIPVVLIKRKMCYCYFFSHVHAGDIIRLYARKNTARDICKKRRETKKRSKIHKKPSRNQYSSKIAAVQNSTRNEIKFSSHFMMKNGDTAHFDGHTRKNGFFLRKIKHTEKYFDTSSRVGTRHTAWSYKTHTHV